VGIDVADKAGFYGKRWGNKLMATILQLDHPQTRRKPVRKVSARDVAVVAFLPVQFFIAWCVPERLWRSIARMVQPLAIPLYVRGGAGHTKNLIRDLMGRQTSANISRKVIQEIALGEFISILEILRDYRPGGWHPKIKITGTHHLDEAHNIGKGAILWISYTHGAKLVSKLAIQRAGYSVSHLSRPRHGLSPTRFGIRFLNWIQTTIENRYIAERIIIQDGEFQKAVRSLMARLRANRVISITVLRDAARPTEVSFLEGRVILADGACRLSYRTGAALLPLFTYRDANGMFNVEIGAPIDTRQAKTEEESVRCAHRDYATWLESFVLAYPGQWLGWWTVL
jgi:lauroyl/myristoyl acyltransferase